MAEKIVGISDQNIEKPIVRYILVLDRSWSMKKVQAETISGFNETVSTIKKQSEKNDVESLVTFILFNDEIEVVLNNVNYKNLKEMTEETYQPNSNTKLNDAVGMGITMIKEVKKDNEMILMTVFTDGDENDSKQYSKKDIAKMIGECKNDGWIINYIGPTTIDLEKVQADYDLDRSNMMQYTTDSIGTQNAYSSLQDSTKLFYARYSKGDRDSTNFFRKSNDDTPKTEILPDKITSKIIDDFNKDLEKTANKELTKLIEDEPEQQK